MKVFIDANILFSAAEPKAATRRLLDALSRHAEVVTCPHAWEEARYNLEMKRPQHTPGLVDLRRKLCVTHAFTPPPGTDLPSSDIPILAGALGARCTHLWTSDKKHFGHYYGTDVGGVRVVSSAMLAAAMLDLGWEV